MSDDAQQRSEAGQPNEPANEAASEPARGVANGLPGEPACPAIVPALAELVAEHHAAVYRYAYRLTGSSADAEDVAQQTFLIAQQKLDQVRDAERVGHWLLAVARNAFLKSHRRRTPLPVGGLEIDVNTLPDPASIDDAGPSSDQEIEPERLQAALDELPDEFRIPVLMFYFEEASYRDIAEQLDLPPGTVMSRLSRAKSHLRRLLIADNSAAQKSDNGHNPASKHRTTAS